jgi:lipopolysaccharide export system permease protein
VIVNRYIQRSIHLGTAGALFLLVSLALFFSFVNELGDLGDDGYGIVQMLEYLALTVPGTVVEFLPLAVLIGSMLSLGSMASNSELIAMQASGVTLWRMLGGVLQAALLIALVSFLLADWIVPDTELHARKIKNQSLQPSSALEKGLQQSSSLEIGQGLWLRDETKVVHVAQLMPNGHARDIEIYHLDDQGGMQKMIKAAYAKPLGGGWELRQVSQTTLADGRASSQQFGSLIYAGNISHELLQVLLVDPRHMSSRDLVAYLGFLDDNQLDGNVEQLIFWQKMFAPLTIVIMCLIAFPFVLGSQRQSNTGQRLLIGILLGLSFVVIDRVLTQLGTQSGVPPFAVALIPNLLFLSFAIYLLFGRVSQGGGLALLRRFFRR